CGWLAAPASAQPELGKLASRRSFSEDEPPTARKLRPRITSEWPAIHPRSAHGFSETGFWTTTKTDGLFDAEGPVGVPRIKCASFAPRIIQSRMKFVLW